MKTNNEMIQEYITKRKLKKNTHYQLKSILEDYSTYQQKSLEELILEADEDEENKIRWKRRRLKTRLSNHMLYLIERLDLSSAKMYLNKIKSFYYFHEIEIHQLPSFNEKNTSLKKPITYKDLPDKEIIKQAVEMSEPLMKSIILFISSSGCARVDTLSFKVRDFIGGTYSYHETMDIKEAIEKMMALDEDIVPTFDSRREKNNKYFITFCSPEATREILNYLKIRLDKIEKRKKQNSSRKDKLPVKDLTLDDPLFKITPDWLTRKFQDLNNTMGLGTVGNSESKKGYIRFRSHMLRKFHASNLKKAGMNEYDINVLQGKSNGKVNDVYFFEDEEKLREDYVKFMHGILIFTDVKTIKSPEFVKMEKEYERFQEIVENIDERIENKIKTAILNSSGALSEDEFDDLFT